MGRNKAWCSAGIDFGQLLFLLYINDLARIINDKNKPRLFADNTSTPVTSIRYILYSLTFYQCIIIILCIYLILNTTFYILAYFY